MTAQLVDEEIREPEQIEPESQVQEESTPEEDIPDKYKGKSLKEIVQMHQEAEKALGRSGSELGELRKLVDQHILSNSAPQPKQEEEEDVDWFSDPDKALESRLNRHPKIKELEQERLRSRQKESQMVLAQAHPDYKEILTDAKFAEWIKASKVRTQLFVQADQNFDADAASELFSLWKERKQLANQTVSVDKEARKSDVKRASTGNARGSSQPQGKKIYRRADIIDLMQKDPERYASLADEIRIAYQEGRVK